MGSGAPAFWYRDDMSDANWWEDGPIFSAQDRGGSITALAPGEHVRLFSGALLALMIVSAAAWSGLFVLWLPRMLQYGRSADMVDTGRSWWWTVLLFGALLFAVVVTGITYSVARRLFRQITLASAVAAISISAGVLAGCWTDGMRISALSADELPDGTIQLIFMGVAALALAGLLIWTPFAIARARRRSRLITRLRQDGVRHDGEVITVGKPRAHQLGAVLFPRVEVTFDDGARSGEVAMSTLSSRVPLPSFPVLVFTDDRGAIHVDPDPARPWPFDPDTAKYEGSADGGGG